MRRNISIFALAFFTGEIVSSSKDVEWQILINRKFVPDDNYINKLAQKMGMRNYGPIFNQTVENNTHVYYRFADDGLGRNQVSRYRRSSQAARCIEDVTIIQSKTRVKRGFQSAEDSDSAVAADSRRAQRSFWCDYLSWLPVVKCAKKGTSVPHSTVVYPTKRGVVVTKPSHQRKVHHVYNDPFYPGARWYLDPLNITGAWELGITGKNVTISVLDDGLEHTHPDLIDNYSASKSTDINGGDLNPFPRPTPSNLNRHGTRCAGVITAQANNAVCNVGIAYNSRISGIRMLDGKVNDMVEAQSVGFKNQEIDIYSASWGPADDGKTVDGPALLTKKAFINGIRYGRSNRGNIFVWASGNGGRFKDSCAADGYANSLYTVSVSAAAIDGSIPWYNEPCASTIVSAYAAKTPSRSRSASVSHVCTTDLKGSCTMRHTGTSAAGPMLAGVIALALEANRNLTWRDIQHLLIKVSTPRNLQGEWRVNAVGRKFSNNFGYGVVDAGLLVHEAKQYTTKLPAARVCEIAVTTKSSVPRKSRRELKAYVTTHCYGHALAKLEHVVLKASIEPKNLPWHSWGGQQKFERGQAIIHVISPSGTRSTVLPQRPSDTSSKSYTKWSFMSVHFWDENPSGEWQIIVENVGKAEAIIKNVSLELYGT